MPENTQPSVIGKPQIRIDGPSRSAARRCTRPITAFRNALRRAGRGNDCQRKIQKLDTSAAEKMPGVRAIFHRANIGKISRSTPGEGFERICVERRPPFEDDVVRYYGQYVALAVGDTFEVAKAAADAVRVTYDKQKPNVEADLQPDDDPEEIATTYGPVKAITKRARRSRKRFRQSSGQN